MLSNYQNIVKRVCVLLLAVISTICTLSACAQQFNNWYFPAYNGISFNNSVPQYLSGGQLQGWYSCATISNQRGELLFSSQGRDVFDRNNNVMPNGTGLLGDLCQINGALIIPYLNDTSLYYLFTAQGLSNFVANSQSQLQYSYSVIDMKLNGGLGDVVSKNNFIRFFSTEKMTAIPHANGTDIWWICRDWSNHFYSYKITCQGFQNSNPTISTIGFDVNNNYNLLSAGDIKASPDGRFIAVAYGQYFEVYEFNRSSGRLTNPIKIPGQCYGVEFSTNSKLLYVSMTSYPRDGTTNTTYQFNLLNYDSAVIYNSAVALPTTTTNGLAGGLQLGPDGKIYHCNGGVPFIDRIEFPNIVGIGCTVTERFLSMPNPNARRFPYAAPFTFINQNVQIQGASVAPDCRTVTLTGKTYVKGNNLVFKWKFGDGDSTVQTVVSGGDTTLATITHFYPVGSDTFNVQLYVTSDTVCGQGSAGKLVVLKPPRPIAAFGYTLNCNQLQVGFLDSSLLNFNASLTYNWQFLDKNNNLLGVLSLKNPVYSYPFFDTVKAKLIVKSLLACLPADTLTKTIYLKAKPTAAFNYTNSCGSLQAVFTNTSTVAGDTLTKYQWFFGDGSTDSARSPQHTYINFGSYNTKLVVQGGNGCTSDTASLPVIIKAKPTAGFSYQNNGCIGQPVSLTDSSNVTSSTPQQYYWQLPDGSTYSSSTITPSFTTAGSQSIRHAAISQQGCSSDTITKNIFIESTPIATISPVSGGCAGQAIAFTSQSTIGTGSISNYKWNFTNIDSSSNASPLFTYNNFGTYAVRLQVTSRNGCTSNTASLPVTIESVPKPLFSSIAALCPGTPILFTNTGSNAFGAVTRYEWKVNGITTSSDSAGFTYTPTLVGSYTVQLQATSSNSCTNSFSQTFTATNPALANAGADTTVRAGETFILRGSGGVNYLWNPPTGLDDNKKATPRGLLQTSQQYVLSITTPQGCTSNDTVLVTVLRSLKIPNIFSPNGDGINETWRIDALQDYPKARMQLYNRYGQQVYNGNSTQTFDGRHNNKPLPAGTYYYIINLNNGFSSKPITGWVMLVR